jgi:hypothetical protein
MPHTSTLIIAGRLTAGNARGPYGGALVCAHMNGAAKPVAEATTDRLGQFTITLDVGRHLALAATDTLSFSVCAARKRAPLFHSKPIALAGAPGTRSQLRHVKLHVPLAALERAEQKAAVRLLADDEPARVIEIGQTLSLAARGLLPSDQYELVFARDGAAPLTQTLNTSPFGLIELTTVLPQFGLWEFDSDRALTVPEALDRFGGQRLEWSLRHAGKPVARGELAVSREITQPLAFVSDKEGRLLNAVEHERDALFLTIAQRRKSARTAAFLVPRQEQWVAGEPFQPALDRAGRPVVFEFELPEGVHTVQLADEQRIPPGAYALIVRHMRYGFEQDERHLLLASDLVVGRRITGLVVREDFWRAKPVLGGCVNAFPMSGAPVSGAPYFRYRDTFAAGEDVWAAMDPGIVMPGQIGKKIALYVVASKTAAQWNASSALTHVAPGTPAEVVLQSGCINANKRLVWPGANQLGTFDIVADFGNNDPNPAAFVSDGSFDTPADMIDGYFAPGFRVVADPGTLTEWPFFGSINVDAPLLAGLGIGATMTVQDENTFYSTPGGFTPVNVNIARLAIIRFPADAAGATQPSQISAAKPSYPLFVVVHGNGHTYTNYAFLLEHMARNGFIAMSIHMQNGLHGLARANAFFDHLNTVNTLFGASVQNKVAVLGHSRGGEAVFKIARLNQTLGLGIGLDALISLAPTDQYGRESIAGAAAVPLFVLYGAKDDDVSGAPSGTPLIRQSGFSLYDRFQDQDKSMAFVYDATHNGFVTHNEAFGAPPPPPLMTVADQQKILLAYCNAFSRLHVLGESQWQGMFTGEWKPPQVAATGATIAFQYRDTTRRSVDTFEGPHAPGDWQTSTIGGAVTESGLPGAPIETQLFVNDNASPHDTGGLRLVWNSAGDQLTFAVPPGQRNVSTFENLSVRLGKVVGGGNPAGDQNLRIALRDGTGNERQIRASAFGRILEPAVANQLSNTKSAMASIRIPLSAYTVVCAGAPQVDLADIVEVKLVFSEIASGDIAVDELEFTQ